MIPDYQKLHLKFKHLDKMLYRLDTEALYYVLKRAESILDFRAEAQLKEEVK